MAFDKKFILASYLNIDVNEIFTDDNELLHYGDSVYSIGDENFIYNCFIKMITNNANKYVLKIDSAKKLLEMGILKVENINSEFEEAIDYIPEDLLLSLHSDGYESLSDILVYYAKKVKVNTEDFQETKEKLFHLKNDEIFVKDTIANSIFELYLVESDYNDFTREDIRKAYDFLNENMNQIGDDALKSFIKHFSYRKGTDFDKLAEVLYARGKDNSELVISMMDSIEDFAHEYKEKIKESYAACLDRKGEVHVVNESSPVFICDVSGLF